MVNYISYENINQGLGIKHFSNNFEVIYIMLLYYILKYYRYHNLIKMFYWHVICYMLCKCCPVGNDMEYNPYLATAVPEDVSAPHGRVQRDFNQETSFKQCSSYFINLSQTTQIFVKCEIQWIA